MADERSFRVSASVALGADAVLRCQMRTPDVVEFFWEQRDDDFDLVFTTSALREFVRQANAALGVVEMFEELEERQQEYGEFRIAQGRDGRISTTEEFRQRLDSIAAGPAGADCGSSRPGGHR